MRALALLMLLPLTLYAAESDIKYRTAARMGKGGVSIATKSDLSTSMFFNPAFLSEQDDFSAEILNPTADTGINSLSILQKNPRPAPGNYYSTISPYFGNSVGATASVAPTLGYKGFALIPAFSLVHGMAELRDPVFTNANGFFTVDFGAGIGKGFKLTENLSVGASLFYIRRLSMNEEADVLSAFNKPKPNKKSGSTVDLNVGAIYQLRNESDLTLGTSVTNAREGRYWDDENEFSYNHRSVSLGASTRLPVEDEFWKKLRIAIDGKDILSKTEPTEKISLGLEYPIFNWIDVRAGVHDLRPTTGLGVKTGYFRLDFGYYSERVRAFSSQYNEHVILTIKAGFNLK